MRRELTAVMVKEFRQTLRDPRMFGVLLVAPILQLTLLGFAVDLDVRAIPTVITDLDRSEASRALVVGFSAQDTFRVLGLSDDPDGALQRGEAKVAVVLPRGLGREGGAAVQVLIDGSDPLVAQAALNASRMFVESRGYLLLAERLEGEARRRGVALYASRVLPVPHVLYNPRLVSAQTMIPGVAAMVLLVVTTVITAMGIARERELGTIEQLMVTPMSPSVLLLGKTLPFAAIGMVTGGLVLTVGTHLFDVPIRGSLVALFLGMALYLLTTLGAGVWVSTLARSQQQAILGAFFVILPAILLSGFMSPVDNMPELLQQLTWFNPVRHFVALLRAVLLKGAGLAELLEPLGMLAAIGLAMQVAASLRFKKQLA
jgi:ABC-2 type transport system permease protein